MISNATAGLIFYGLALLALVWLLGLLHRLRAVRAWPIVTGRIIESRIETDADANACPRVRYAYTVDGREFEGDRILPHGEFASTGSYAAKVVARYPAGRRVPVHVNPNRPADAVLELSLPLLVPIMLVVAVVAFGLVGSALRT